jgi:hypothetical protein
MGQQSDVAQARFLMATLAGASFVCVTQILNAPSFSWILEIATGCFAAAIPILGILLMKVWDAEVGKIGKSPTDDFWFKCASVLAMLAAVAGIALLFFHLSTTGGVIFVIAVVVGCLIEWLYR